MLLLVEKISSRETTITENVTYHVSTTSALDESFNTSLSKTNKTLLFFIKMVGGIDIILLAAYVAMFKYDQRRGEKVAKFSSAGQQPSGQNTTYENISFPLFDEY